MSEIANNLAHLKSEIGAINPKATLIAVSKTKPIPDLETAYNAGQRHFGENKVQELVDKRKALPPDILWHFIGHLQRNKVKNLIPGVFLIHSVDSIRLLNTIQKKAQDEDVEQNVLLQVHIALEDTKYGFDAGECLKFFEQRKHNDYPNVIFKGLMGMATFTDDSQQIYNEFTLLKSVFDKIRGIEATNVIFDTLSAGMSSDYRIALNCGATHVRIGSQIFGARNYN